MKAPPIDPKLVLYGAAAIAVLYVTWKATKAAGSAIDTVTGIPGRVGDAIGSAWSGLSDAAASAWHGAADIFNFSSVGIGTTTTPRTVTPTDATFSELSGPGVFGTIDPFDPRYYGVSVQGASVLPATTAQAGPGGGQGTLASIGTGGAFFNSAGNFSGM